MSLHRCSIYFSVRVQAAELSLSVFDHVHRPRLSGSLTLLLRFVRCVEVRTSGHTLLVLLLGQSFFSSSGHLECTCESTHCNSWGFLGLLQGHRDSSLLFKGIYVLDHRPCFLNIRDLSCLSLAFLLLQLCRSCCFFLCLYILVNVSQLLARFRLREVNFPFGHVFIRRPRC